MSTPFDTDGFKALQAKWYAKLKKAGFQDVELPERQVTTKTGLMLCVTAFKDQDAVTRFRRRVRSQPYNDVVAQAEYYRQATAYLHTGKFKSPKEKRVWELHSDGVSLSKIAKATGLHKSAVNRRIIRHRKLAGLAK